MSNSVMTLKDSAEVGWNWTKCVEGVEFAGGIQ